MVGGIRNGVSRGRWLGLAVAVTGWCLAGAAVARDSDLANANAVASATPRKLEDLRDLSIEQLAQVEVTSVSKSPEALSDAPAAIYVITHDQIMRSGATTIPEMLRLAPNLQVAQTSASHYTITARGFSGNSQAQNFSDKLLVLIDGRSVYTPLFSGVYWDLQDVPRENIERIEVISGPGATLWGANAVNGVINIITRKAADTSGGSLDLTAGSQGQTATLQYGGQIKDGLDYRVYARGLRGEETRTATGAKAHDGWTKPQGGFRLDWAASPSDSVTVQGDAFAGDENQLGAADENISGANLLTRWTHTLQGGSALQVQAYYDRTSRSTGDGGGRFVLNTYDFDVQHNFALNSHNDIVWGVGVRAEQYRIVGTPGLFFTPTERTMQLVDFFLQDTVSITDRVKLTLGLKLENDPYSGLAAMPSARLSWKTTDSTLVWASVSRAIRSPTPFDRDVVEKLGSLVFLVGASDFQPEKLTAYELGFRAQPFEHVSFSVSTFYNVYDDLKSIEVNPSTVFPLQWGNGMLGHVYGVEAWGDWQVTPWWRLDAAFDVLSEHLKFRPGASGLLGIAQAGDDPAHQASLRSSMNLGHDVSFDADLRYVGALPDPHVPSYVELNARIAWTLSDHLQLAISGLNLLHDRHQEFPAPANAVPRSVFGELRWHF
jgi:iron complex outermembrane receptor protein